MTISKFINSILILLTIIAFIAQLFIDFSTVNIATSTIILVSGLFVLLYFRWSDALETHPLSSFAILGFSITTVTGALWAQSASWLAVSADLRQPLITFPVLALYQAIAIIAHVLYRWMNKKSPTESPSLLRRSFEVLGVYEVQSISILWIVGIFGLFCVLLSRVFPLANGFSYLAWTPFLIPIYSAQIGKDYCNIKINYLFLALHTLTIAMLAIFFNSRGELLAGFATVGLIFLLTAMRSQKLVTTHSLFRGLFVVLVGIALSFPANDLVKAMMIARLEQGRASYITTMQNTIKNFTDSSRLERFSKLELARNLRSAYDEKYIENPMIARLVTTKFNDNAIYFAGRLSDKDKDYLLGLTGDFFWVTLPQPFLDAFKIGVDKEKLRFTVGDVLANMAIGSSLGGYRTGSVFAQGLALFGNLFVIVYFAMCLILFASIDIFSKWTANGVVALSAIGMLRLWPNFIFGITADSLHVMFIGVVRGVVQSVLLYFIAISIAKFITKVFGFKAISN